MSNAPSRSRQRPAAPPPEAEVEEVDNHPNLNAIIAQVSGRMGSGVMRKATAIPGFNQTETGIFMLDMALLGGIAEGLTTMIYGWESSGKTTLAKRIAGRMQKKYPGKAVVFVDLEQTYDRQWGEKHGIDNENLFIVQPESGEQAVDIIDAVIRAPETACVIIDSLPALVPQAEVDSSAEDALVAVRARLIGRLCSKILQGQIASRHQGNYVTVILINQYRTKIGVVKGDNRVLPGGNQPKYLCTTMIEMKNKEIMGRSERDMEVVDHNDHAFTIKKSRVGNSMRTGEFTMVRNPDHPLGEGAIDESTQVATYAKRFGLITGGGSSWKIDGVADPENPAELQRFRKLDEIKDWMDDPANEEAYTDLKRRIIMILRQDMGLLPLPPDGYLLGWCELVEDEAA